MGRLVKQPHGGAIYLCEKGETKNPHGRPKPLALKMKAEGYKMQDINATIENMLAMTMTELKAVFDNPEATALEKTIAKAMAKSIEKGSLYSLETLLSRRFGKPKETQDVQMETTVVHRIKIA
jgi:hypothetical protein